MRKEDFTKFLEENILSVFTGSEIIGEELSTNRDALVALGTGGTILAKYSKNDDYRIIIKRIQPFKAFEVSLVKSIIEEISLLSNLNMNREYMKIFQAFAIEKAICKALSPFAHNTLQELINELGLWSQRTYEGKKLQFGFILSAKKSPRGVNPNLHIKNLLSEDFCALLSDGVSTCLEIASNGYLLGYLTIPKNEDQSLLCPYQFLRIANICTGNKIGVSLLVNGDILLFKEKTLLFAKKGGFWVSFSHDEIVHRLGAEKAGSEQNQSHVEGIRKSIYLSALDISFSKTGGCIVHLNKEDERNILKHIDIFDILLEKYFNVKQEEVNNQTFFDFIKEDQKLIKYEDFLSDAKSAKVSNLRKIINGRKFQELDRRLRAELLSIDGATVVDNDGDIVAVGAIIKIEAGSTGGGRLAAAKTLSKYGVAIKISADGAMEGYRMDRNKLRIRPIFIIG